MRKRVFGGQENGPIVPTDWLHGRSFCRLSFSENPLIPQTDSLRLAGDAEETARGHHRTRADLRRHLRPKTRSAGVSCVKWIRSLHFFGLAAERLITASQQSDRRRCLCVL